MLTQEKVGETAFGTQLSDYKNLIDSRVEEVSTGLVAETIEKRGNDAAAPIEAYCSVLSRGGKRIRGMLVMNGYELSGGRNQDVALDAACAMELMHAYVLVFDDIQDRSRTRRGGPTAQRILENYSIDEGWDRDHLHTGRSLAELGAMSGQHKAQRIINSLDVPSPNRQRAIEMINETMMMTADGQTLDIINQVKNGINWNDIEKVMDLKTSQYTIRAPLQFGMLLAGASHKNLKLVEPYAQHAGRAYQIRDDLLPYVSETSDKDQASDIKEGKRNLVIFSALRLLDSKGEEYLKSCLGKRDLTNAEFERCKDLIIQSGAVRKLTESAQESVDQAVEEIYKLPPYLNQNTMRFLGNLAEHILVRDS